CYYRLNAYPTGRLDGQPLEQAAVVRYQKARQETRQDVGGFLVLRCGLTHNVGVLEAIPVPLDGAAHSPGGNTGCLPSELQCQAVVSLVRGEIPLERDHFHAPPQPLVLSLELRLVVGRQE